MIHLLSRMRVVFCLGVILWMLTPGVWLTRAETPPVPPLPSLPLDAFPPATREALEAPWRRAHAQPNDADAVGHLALVLHAWDEREAAAAAYARAQALAPTQVDWWYLGGLNAHRRALPSEARRQFQQAHRLAPDNVLIALRLADAHLEEGAVDAAETLYEALGTRPDTAPAAHYGLGRIQQSRGEFESARGSYARALAVYPDFGAAHYALAQLQRRAGDLPAAKASLQRQQQCLACWPMPQDPWRDRVESLRDDAGILLQRGSARASGADAAAAAEAIRLHEAALERDPSLSQAHANLITLYGQTGNIVRAEHHYLAAIDRPGFAADAHRAFAWLLLTGEKPREALDVFRAAVGISPTDASALHGTGLAHELLDAPADAVAAYTRALEADPTARPIRFTLARSLVRLGRMPEAIAQLERLREPEDADTPRYIFALAVAHVRAGDLARGRAAAEEALELARRYEQTDFATSVEAEIAKLPR
jgi:tetratricopeptide (TPR) repeat protein